MNAALHKLKIAFGVLIGLLAASQALAQNKDDVSVAFIYNFGRFVTWPDSAFASADAPFVIGVLGNDAFADKLADAVQGKNIEGRDVSVRKMASPADLSGCQIAYLGSSSGSAAFIAAAKGKPILIVGDGRSFIEAGGMIGLSMENTHIVFDVNLGTLGAASLKPSPKLTKAARSAVGG